MHQLAKILFGFFPLMLLFLFTACSSDLNSDLLHAAVKGDNTAVKALLAKGAEVNAIDKNGSTALMFAAFGGHTVIVQTLLDQGADINAKDNKDSTALMLAASEGHDEIVGLLNKASRNEKDVSGSYQRFLLQSGISVLVPTGWSVEEARTSASIHTPLRKDLIQGMWDENFKMELEKEYCSIIIGAFTYDLYDYLKKQRKVLTELHKVQFEEQTYGKPPDSCVVFYYVASPRSNPLGIPWRVLEAIQQTVVSGQNVVIKVVATMPPSNAEHYERIFWDILKGIDTTELNVERISPVPF